MNDLDKDLKMKLSSVKVGVKEVRKAMIHRLLIDLYKDLDKINENLSFEDQKKFSDRYDLFYKLLEEEGYTR